MSHFLQLLPELRNQIFGYVLDLHGSFHDGQELNVTVTHHSAHYRLLGVLVLIDYDEKNPIVTEHRARELEKLNRLNYVNEQLYAETTTFALEYNKHKLEIEQTWSEETAPVLQLCTWIDSVDIKELHTLNKLVISTSGRRYLSDAEPIEIPETIETIETMRELHRMMKACPNITVVTTTANLSLTYGSRVRDEMI